MYEIGDEIYCIHSVADCTQGTIYAVTGFGFSIVSKNLNGSPMRVYSLRKLYDKDIVYIEESALQDNFISGEQFFKSQRRNDKIKNLLNQK